VQPLTKSQSPRGYQVVDKAIRLLVVEDSEDDALIALQMLHRGGFEVQHARVETAAALAAALRSQTWDAVISDYHLPGFNGMEALETVRAAQPDMPFILMSGKAGEEIAVDAMRAGADDYLVKDNLPRLASVLERTLAATAIRAAHRRAQRDLVESEARFRSLTELSSDWYWEQDREFRLIYHSGGFAQRSGTTSDKLLGKRRWEAPDRFPLQGSWDDHRATLEAHAPFRDFEYVKIGDDGRQTVFSLSGVPVFDAAGRFSGYRGVGTNITARKLAEAKIRRQAQLYAALSECNKAIVHCATAEELFSRICQAAVRFGGMKMAWIGMVDAESRMIRPAAGFGDGAEDLGSLPVSAAADNPFGGGTGGTAIRENRPYWCQDYANDPLTSPWRARAARAGWAASASLPLRKGGVVVGVFFLYSGQLNAFDEATRDLLIEMARDISFALENFDREARRKRAKKELEAAEGRFRGLVEHAIAGIYIIQDDKLVYVNPRFAEIFGYGSPDELIGRSPAVVVADADRTTVAENMRRRIEGEIVSINYDFIGLRKDGTRVEIGAHGAAATHGGRPAVIGLLQDISAKKRAEEEIRHYISKVEAALVSTVEVATAMSEMRDPYTAGHQRRVAEIAVAIGAELGFDARRQEGLRVAGNLHDIGKFNIPSEILSKPGKLSPIEFQLVQSHAKAGFDVLKSVQFPWPVAEVALQHHERLDGSGYPQGLKGEAILLEARIMAVADILEAMSSHRPYRAGLGLAAALAQLEHEAGSKLDAAVVAACERLFREKGFQLPA
jgi:PAS domain S-box-containing protein